MATSAFSNDCVLNSAVVVLHGDGRCVQTITCWYTARNKDLKFILFKIGIIYDVIVEPPSIGSTTDERGHSRPVSLQLYIP